MNASSGRDFTSDTTTSEFEEKPEKTVFCFFENEAEGYNKIREVI